MHPDQFSTVSENELVVRQAESVRTDSRAELANLKNEISEIREAGAKELVYQKVKTRFPDAPEASLRLLFSEKLKTITDTGIGPEILLTELELFDSFVAPFFDEFAAREEQSQEDSRSLIHSRLLQLKEEGVSLEKTLAALRLEFKEKIDEETDAVLAQFEALFSPSLIPDEKERAVVENLFLSQSFSEFTPVVFSGFLTTIYEQPDEVISAETKARIKQRFKPKQRIETVGELKKRTFQKNENGEYEHNSPETALVLENGMSSYVDSNHEIVIIYVPEFREPRPIYIRSIFYNQTNENSAKYLNYGVIHREIFERFDSLSGLFGGRMINDDWPVEKRREAIEKSSKFFRCLVGPRDPHHLIQFEDMQVFGPAMNALANPLNLSRTENLNDMRELGILDGTEFNWERLSLVGGILRQNRSFQTQAVRNPAAPFLLLKQELAKHDPS